jgi:hypothetical protein
VWHRGASEPQHSVYVDIECLAPIRFGYLEESTRDRRARRVHKNVDSPPKGTRFGNCASTTLNVAYVGLDVNGFSAMRRCNRLEHFEWILPWLSPHDRNVSTARGKRQSRHRSNTTCSPRDQTHLACQFHRLCHP